MKKLFGGGGCRKLVKFHSEVFAIFEIVIYVAFREYTALFTFFVLRYSLLMNLADLIENSMIFNNHRYSSTTQGIIRIILI